MTSFQADDGNAIEKMSEVEDEIRALVRREGTAARRAEARNDAEPVAASVSSLVHRVSGTSVQEIDRLINRLHSLRDTLHQQGERVAREIAQYAALSEAARKSTLLLSETLAPPPTVEAPSISE
ncbi:MAG: hypothetical protein ACJ8F3_11125 [Xanthobacteraceae bacterium]